MRYVVKHGTEKDFVVCDKQVDKVVYRSPSKRAADLKASWFNGKDVSPDELTFEQCCQFVLDECPDPYAKSYAAAGLGPEIQNEDYKRVQCLYILNNTNQWRGETARHVKANLKRLSTKQ